MKFQNKIISFFLLFIFNIVIYAQLLDIPNESWLTIKQKLVDAGETDKLLELEIWFDIEEHYQLARKAHNEKIQVCWDIASNNKPPIADLLQAQFDQQYLKENRKNIAHFLSYLNNKLHDQCSKHEREEHLQAEMIFFSNMEHYLYNVKALIRDGYFEQELVNQVLLALEEASSQLGKDITLENIREYYFEMPFSITDTYMLLSLETRHKLYKRRAEKAPLEIQEFLTTNLTEPIERLYLIDEAHALPPEIYDRNNQ